MESSTAQRSGRGASSSPPSMGGVCDFEQGLCGWTHDPSAPLHWSLHSSSKAPAQGPSLDLALPPTDLNSYLYIEANTKTEQQRARILSPVVGPDTGPLCLLFSYQLWGEAQGTLHVLLRDAHHEETLLWALRGDQGPVWKEGRTILPRSPKEFQVVMEGFFDRGTKGQIMIDNIHMSSGTPLEECTQPFAAFPPDMTGGGVPGGSDPTVDTLALPLIPTLWYYLVAAGGALILLAVAILVRVLCCHRRRLAAKKSQLSVAYHSQSQYFQYSQSSASNPVTAAPGTEPVLTVRLDNHGHQQYALC